MVTDASPDVREMELRMANLVQMLYARALTARRPLIGQWKKNYRVLHNRFWAPRVEPWMPNPEIAEIFPVIAALVAWMTDQRPILEVNPSAIPFSPYADFYQTLASDMNAILQAIFLVNTLDAEICKVLWDVMTYGVGYTKTVWEPWLADGLGDSVFRRVNPFDLYPDPTARNTQDAGYIIEAKIMSADDMERSYPGAQRKVGTGQMGDHDESPHRLDVHGSLDRYDSLFPDNLPGYDTRRPSSRVGSTGPVEKPLVLVLECWIRTPEVREEENGKVCVYDRWRCIVTCGSRVLLDCPAEEINAYGTHPYDKMVLTDTGEWYGPCMVEMLTSPQESINRILQSIEQNIALVGNPMLVENQRSTSRNKRLTNKPGARIEADPSQIKWMDPPQMQPQIAVQLLTYYQGKIETISGLSAIVRGFSPNNRNSAGVMDSVQDAAFVRVRATLRELERMLRGACSKMCANVAEFYTEPRIVSLLGPDGDRTSRAIKARHFYILDNSEKGERVPLRFNLLADAGSQLPTSKQARSAEAERLYALGLLDVLETLKAMQWPNFAQVAKRVMDLQASQGMLGQPPGARQRTRA